MKIKVIVIILVVAFLLTSVSLGYAYMTDYSLPWWTVDAGGGTSENSEYILNGTIGQADARSLRGGDYFLAGGFLGGGWVAVKQLYLPMISR